MLIAKREKWTPEKRQSVLEEASKSGNISMVCNKYRIARTTFYNWKRRYDAGGLEALKDQSKCPRNFQPRCRDPQRVKKIIRYVLNHPEFTLQKYTRIMDIPKSTIHDALVAEGLSSRKERWLHLEKKLIKDGQQALSKAQKEFVFSQNPALQDYFTNKNIFSCDDNIWQLGAIYFRNRLYIVIINTNNSYVIKFDKINNFDINNMTSDSSYDVSENFIKNIGEDGCIFVNRKIYFSKNFLPQNIFSDPFYTSNDIDEHFPFGMLERFKNWATKRLRTRTWKCLSDEWNHSPLPGYPLFGKKPERVYGSISDGTRKRMAFC